MSDTQRNKMGIRISILERVMKIYFNRGLEDMQIGWGQQYAMEFIDDYPGITALELAGYLYVDKATVTKLIKKLSELDYIKVETDDTDRRIKHLYLTEPAKDVVKRIRTIQKEFEEDLLDGIDEAGKKELAVHMEQMIDNITQKTRYKLEKPYLEREGN